MPLPPSITIDHEELEGSPRESYSEAGDYTGTRELVCSWDSASALINQIMGGAVGGTGNGAAVYTLGQAFPLRADETNPPRAVGYSLEPFGGCPEDGGNGRVASYSKAKLTFVYKRGLFEDEQQGGQSDVLIEETIEPEAEVINVRGKTLGWVTEFGAHAKACEALDLSEVPGRTITSLGWLLTFHRVTTFSTAFIDLLGHINSTVVRSRKFDKTFEGKTLLYTAMTATRRFFSTGEALWTLSTRFSYRRNQRALDGAVLGWNGFWRASADDFDQIAPATVSPGAGTRTCGTALSFYPMGDFSAMSVRQDAS